METVENRIREFIRETFPMPGDEPLPPEQSLFQAGVLDSIGVLSLVMWLEQEFEIVVDDDDVVPENIDGIGPLVRYVQNKRRAGGLDA